MKVEHRGVPGSLVLTLLFVCVFLVVKGRCVVYRSLQWTPENPLFMSNSSQCVEGEVPQMNVLPDSTFHVICPTTVTVLETVLAIKSKHDLIENLWIIYDKKSFETCNVNTTNAVLLKKKNRPLMECDKPLELKYYTIVFQRFSAVSGGLEFTPGEDYYFLATSDGTSGSLNNTAGGHCNDTKNSVCMKFKVYVCKDENDTQCTQSEHKLGTFFCGKVTTPLSASIPVLVSSLTPSTSELLYPSTTHMVLVNKTVHVNSSTPSSALSQPSVQPLSQDFTAYTYGGVTTIKPNPHTSSAAVLSPRTVVSSVTAGSECFNCEPVKQMKQQAPSKDKDTWRPLAIFFICSSCVLLVVAVVIYVKFYKKRAYNVSPSTNVPVTADVAEGKQQQLFTS